MRTISIGKQDFVSLREKQYFYIDKTDFIKRWWEAADDVTLITRPRRFGKTFNLSTVNAFFSTCYENRGDLFENLKIWQEDAYRALQGTYPVIFMSFGSEKGKDYKDTMDAIIDVVADAYEQHSYLKESSALTINERESYDFFKGYRMSGYTGRHMDEQLVKKGIFMR